MNVLECKLPMIIDMIIEYNRMYSLQKKYITIFEEVIFCNSLNVIDSLDLPRRFDPRRKCAEYFA